MARWGWLRCGELRNGGAIREDQSSEVRVRTCEPDVRPLIPICRNIDDDPVRVCNLERLCRRSSWIVWLSTIYAIPDDLESKCLYARRSFGQIVNHHADMQVVQHA